MAKSDAVWGIDMGQCAMKALRCRAHGEEDRIVADAFDYIEYPKVLSQPDADPEELITDALKQFLSRNEVRGDRVAIGVSGQTGLARFIKLPPVEAKKIPDIVRYEARQQIPFDLNDVIWDYQRMGGGSEEEGFALETEIGLFAMKRDAVLRALEPYQKAGVEVDFVQLTPLALYNYLLFDQMQDLPRADEYDPEDPPDSIVLISLGTDATDLVITNGFHVWQRSIPLGGNHFTKALTKQLKLTFAKAEHLKRNAAAAQDPKAVFQAMRPVFSDLLTELQRSIGYFSSIDRAAKIRRVVALGNAMKLPGLRRYLSQSLGFEVERIDEFRGLSGSQVLTAPAFSENSLSFAVCYGLVLQGLGKSGLKTNLLPKEIVKDRFIRQKKPWAVAAAAVLLLGCTVSFFTVATALSSVNEKKWQDAESQANLAIDDAARHVADTERAVEQFKTFDGIGSNLVSNVEGRVRWLELLRTVNDCLPRDPEGKQPEDISKRNELHITNLECQYLADVFLWFGAVKKWHPLGEDVASEKAGAAPAAEPSPPPRPGADITASGTLDQQEEGKKEGPSGPGWIVRVSGHHFHNSPPPLRPDEIQGPQYVRDTLIKNLHTAKITLPKSNREEADSIEVARLGISYPVLVDPQKLTDFEVVNPNFVASPKDRVSGAKDSRKDVVPVTGAKADDDEGVEKLRRFDFEVHFCWQPISPTQREEAQREEARKQQEQQNRE